MADTRAEYRLVGVDSLLVLGVAGIRLYGRLRPALLELQKFLRESAAGDA